MTIIHMISPENEEVHPTKFVNPLDSNSVPPVEQWLADIEEAMKLSLKQILKDSIDDY